MVKRPYRTGSRWRKALAIVSFALSIVIGASIWLLTLRRNASSEVKTTKAGGAAISSSTIAQLEQFTGISGIVRARKVRIRLFGDSVNSALYVRVDGRQIESLPSIGSFKVPSADELKKIYPDLTIPEAPQPDWWTPLPFRPSDRIFVEFHKGGDRRSLIFRGVGAEASLYYVNVTRTALLPNGFRNGLRRRPERSGIRLPTNWNSWEGEMIMTNRDAFDQQAGAKAR